MKSSSASPSLLCCDNPKCLWNGARDYAASLNIARLGLAYLVTYHTTKRYQAYRMTDSSVKPASYTGADATLLLPSQGITPRPHEGKYIYYAGWSYSTSLRTSQAKSLLAVLSTARLRKYLLKSA
jgi:putative transposase